MDAAWLPAVCSMLKVCSLLVSHGRTVIGDVLVDWVIKGFQSLNLMIWMKDVCCTGKGSFPWSQAMAGTI